MCGPHDTSLTEGFGNATLEADKMPECATGGNTDSPNTLEVLKPPGSRPNMAGGENGLTFFGSEFLGGVLV